jgi:hypothetical protein
MAASPTALRIQARTRAGSLAEIIARRIAETTRDGDELVEFALRVFRDPTMPFEDRRWAMEWLADRGAGRAMAKLEVSGAVSHTVRPNLEDYTFEELEEMERIEKRAAERKRIAGAKVIDAVSEVKP